MRDQDRKDDMSKKKTGDDEDLNANEGEGSTSAARRYDEAVEEFTREKNVEELAEEAAKELDDEEEGGKEAA
jgi:hypothetical protein